MRARNPLVLGRPRTRRDPRHARHPEPLCPVVTVGRMLDVFGGVLAPECRVHFTTASSGSAASSMLQMNQALVISWIANLAISRAGRDYIDPAYKRRPQFHAVTSHRLARLQLAARD